MTTPTIIETTIAHGENRYKLHRDGTWSALMFGSFMNQKCPGLTWRWVAVPADKIPQEVKKAAGVK